MATSVCTVPALAAVGLTESAARQSGASVDVHIDDMLYACPTFAADIKHMLGHA